MHKLGKKEQRSQKRLVLSKETFRLLTSQELKHADGGAGMYVALCPSDECTNECGSTC